MQNQKFWAKVRFGKCTNALQHHLWIWSHWIKSNLLEISPYDTSSVSPKAIKTCKAELLRKLLRKVRCFLMRAHLQKPKLQLLSRKWLQLEYDRFVGSHWKMECLLCFWAYVSCQCVNSCAIQHNSPKREDAKATVLFLSMGKWRWHFPHSRAFRLWVWFFTSVYSLGQNIAVFY